MKITPPNDDVRFQRLSRPAKARGEETRDLEELHETKSTPAVDEREHPEKRRQPVMRRGSDRREGDRERRKKQVKVLLDTRTGRERRGLSRRRQDAEREDREERPRSINIKA